MTKLLFIINPISGGKRSSSLQIEVVHGIKQIRDAEYAFTDCPGHAKELATNAVKEGYDVVAAVGGDGTVNEVASSLIETETALGIIPLGSGNGLARHLGLPFKPQEAIENILTTNPIRIDSATINGIPFFCSSGIGFDAKVAADYAKSGSRGLFTYTKEAIRDWFSYKPGEYVIETDEGTVHTQALLVTIGNANQWGNDYFITPQASLNDGKLDIAIVKPASIISDLKMVSQLRNKTLMNNPDVQYLRSSYAVIDCASENYAAHYDGEAIFLNGRIRLECKPDSLNVIPGSCNYLCL